MRVFKERYGFMDMCKVVNCVNFNEVEEEVGYDGEGFGTLGFVAGFVVVVGRM